jgi:molybdate transport system substrate-binding protein
MLKAILRCLGFLVCGAVLLVFSQGSARAVDLTVSAAASLTNAFQEIGKAYEQANTGDKVLFNLGASGSLLQQITRGAPVDVFASADLETMDRAEKQNAIVRDTRGNFASNKLVLVVPAGSAVAVSRLEDLRTDAVRRIATGIPDSVPVGRYTKGVLEAAKLWEPLQPKLIFAQNVRQCLDYVARGEVDAGFVYLTDAQVSGGRVKVALEVPVEKPILYPIAVVKGNGNERGARRFVDFVRSPAGLKILAKYGFGPP